MSEQEWPVCEECGKRHPQDTHIYSALVNNSIENKVLRIKLRPTQVYEILDIFDNAGLKEQFPKLAPNVNRFTDNFYKNNIPLIAEHEGSDTPLELSFTLSDLTLITFCLKYHAAHTDRFIDIQEYISDVITKAKPEDWEIYDA